jgi:hypothetical protein
MSKKQTEKQRSFASLTFEQINECRKMFYNGKTLEQISNKTNIHIVIVKIVCYRSIGL